MLGWRDVPIDPAHVGRVARDVMPVFRQVYVRMRRVPPIAWERTLYVIRKLAENRIRERGADPTGYFHVASLSTETIVYKGLLLPRAAAAVLPRSARARARERDRGRALAVLDEHVPDVGPRAAVPLHRAQRRDQHAARQRQLDAGAAQPAARARSSHGGLERLFPIIVPGKSDSAQFDNMVELLTLGGRTLPHAMMMMIPEAWENGELDDDRTSFYRYAASLVEPWDGPAAIVFSDGQLVGATLDRNGLRPARWTITTDDRVILASETGVIDVPPERVRAKGRLTPGMMFVVDTAEGRIVDDAELKRDVAGRFPYRKWLDKNVFELAELDDAAPPPRDRRRRARCGQQRAFGYTDEDVELIVEPMARDRQGADRLDGHRHAARGAVAIARRTCSAYFHQLFAQVTNPPIDPIREALVMSLETTMGPDGNTFDETPEQCHQLRLRGPMIDNRDLAKIRAMREGVFDPATLSLLWPIADGAERPGRGGRSAVQGGRARRSTTATTC